MTQDLPRSQKRAFLEGEGDAWFARNVARLGHPENDIVVNAMEALHIQPRRLLEIGCANGWRPAVLSQRLSAQGFGIDPSAKAIEDGRKRFPKLTLEVGTADALKFEDGMFDLVIFGFSLYLVDPKDYFRCVEEADRVLADGGVLAIFDFLPPFPYANDYVHLPGVRAHKMIFSNLFTAHPAYTLLSRSIKPEGAGNPDQREGIDILHKRLVDAFPARPANWEPRPAAKEPGQT